MERRLTTLADLIRDVVPRATVTTIASATEKIAEDMAREILKDPAWRAEMQALIRQNFAATLVQIANGRRMKRPSGRRKKR